jgi:Lipopolysaccharide kinase (Kdo/WaaP) family
MEVIERDGWRLLVGDFGLTTAVREAVVVRTLEASRGELGSPRRRSRHASTWPVRIGAGAELQIFIKLLDAPRGLEVIKRAVRGGRADHVARITQRLNDSGFLAPPLLAYGREAASGREIMVTPRAEGEGPLRTIKVLRTMPVDRKRAVFRALGAEIARLHRCGFVHGDLTPFNIFFVRTEPPRFVFIDHERTRSAGLIGRRRQMLRNLVQLGRFAMPGITATDRMRVLFGYAAMMDRRERRVLVQRVGAMLARRIRRDGVAQVEDPSNWRKESLTSTSKFDGRVNGNG